MLTVFADTFKIATMQDSWNPPANARRGRGQDSWSARVRRWGKWLAA